MPENPQCKSHEYYTVRLMKKFSLLNIRKLLVTRKVATIYVRLCDIFDNNIKFILRKYVSACAYAYAIKMQSVNAE